MSTEDEPCTPTDSGDSHESANEPGIRRPRDVLASLDRAIRAITAQGATVISRLAPVPYVDSDAHELESTCRALLVCAASLSEQDASATSAIYVETTRNAAGDVVVEARRYGAERRRGMREAYDGEATWTAAGRSLREVESRAGWSDCLGAAERLGGKFEGERGPGNRWALRVVLPRAEDSMSGSART